MSVTGALTSESIGVGVPIKYNRFDHYGDIEYDQRLSGSAPLTVGLGVAVSGHPGTGDTFLWNEFMLGEGSAVNGNVSVKGVSINTIGGTVMGNVQVRATDAKTNSFLDVTGQVDKNLTYESAASSSVTIAGTVKGNVNLRATGNYTSLSMTGQEGNALTLTDGAGDRTVTISDPALEARAVILPGEGEYTLN